MVKKPYAYISVLPCKNPADTKNVNATSKTIQWITIQVYFLFESETIFQNTEGKAFSKKKNSENISITHIFVMGNPIKNNKSEKNRQKIQKMRE